MHVIVVIDSADSLTDLSFIDSINVPQGSILQYEYTNPVGKKYKCFSLVPLVDRIKTVCRKAQVRCIYDEQGALLVAEYVDAH